MKYFIEGRERKIYFTKDNTAFYKSKRNNIDVTYMFKKTKKGLELRKKYLKTGGGQDGDQPVKNPIGFRQRATEYLFPSKKKEREEKEEKEEEEEQRQPERDSKYSTILGHFDTLDGTIQNLKSKPNFDDKDKYDLLMILWKIRINLHYYNANTIMQEKSSSSNDSKSDLKLKAFDIILREYSKPLKRNKLEFDSDTLEDLALRHIPNMAPSQLMDDNGETTHYTIPDDIDNFLQKLLTTDYKRQVSNNITEKTDEETAEERAARKKRAEYLAKKLKEEKYKELKQGEEERKRIEKKYYGTQMSAREYPDHEIDLKPPSAEVIQKRYIKIQIKKKLLKLVIIVKLLVKKYIEDEKKKTIVAFTLDILQTKLKSLPIKIPENIIEYIIEEVAIIVKNITQKTDLISKIQNLVDMLKERNETLNLNNLNLDLYYVNNKLEEILQLEELEELEELENYAEEIMIWTLNNLKKWAICPM